MATTILAPFSVVLNEEGTAIDEEITRPMVNLDALLPD